MSVGVSWSKATYVSIALTGHNSGLRCLRIPETLEAPSLRVFPHTWLNNSPSSWGKHKISSVFTIPRSEPRSPLKNIVLKKAWSRAKINRPEGLIECAAIFRFKKRARSNNFGKNRGTACFGAMRACNGSSVDAFWYFCTSGEAAGLPEPNIEFHSPQRPVSLNIARSFPM